MTDSELQPLLPIDRWQGCGLFADRPYETGAVITVYDGVVERTGALLYDPRQRCVRHIEIVPCHSRDEHSGCDL